MCGVCDDRGTFRIWYSEFRIPFDQDMATALAIFGWILFGLAILIGLLLDLVGLFGNWVILCAVTAAWLASGFSHFTGWAVWSLLALAVLGEIIEMLASSFGAAKFGGGKGAAVSAMIGCIAGAIIGSPVLPIIGTLIGACAGAFIAASAYEIAITRKSVPGSLWTGVGAALGKVAGLVGKLIVGLLMLLVAVLMH